MILSKKVTTIVTTLFVTNFFMASIVSRRGDALFIMPSFFNEQTLAKLFSSPPLSGDDVRAKAYGNFQ